MLALPNSQMTAIWRCNRYWRSAALGLAVVAPGAKYCGTIALGIHRARAPSPSFEWLEWDLKFIALFTRRW